MVLTPLHVASAPVHTLDARLLALACIASAVALLWIWFPGHARAIRRRIDRAGIARSLAVVMLFMAVLPLVVPVDHIFGHVDVTGPGESALHAAHCHGSPGSCADAPLTSGPGQLLMSDPLLMSPAMLTVRMQTFAVVLAGRTVLPDLRPPIA
jgi:hypothetical protein